MPTGSCGRPSFSPTWATRRSTSTSAVRRGQWLPRRRAPAFCATRTDSRRFWPTCANARLCRFRSKRASASRTATSTASSLRYSAAAESPSSSCIPACRRISTMAPRARSFTARRSSARRSPWPITGTSSRWTTTMRCSQLTRRRATSCSVAESWPIPPSRARFAAVKVWRARNSSASTTSFTSPTPTTWAATRYSA